ncbi:MAG: thiamine phosphate synthase [SAR202 cluster bacterium]|nr:thiamine phosphate synthase [SAR202 cluster bacterium]
MTTWKPGTGPDAHRTEYWLLSGLEGLHRDVSVLFRDPGDDRILKAIKRTAQALGFERVLPVAGPPIHKAIAELSPLEGLFAGPNFMEVKFMAQTLGLLAVAETADLMPKDVEATFRRPDLTGLSDALFLMSRAAGSGFRKRAAERFRGLYVIVDPDLTNGRDPRWVAEEALRGGATAIQFRNKSKDKGDVLPLARDLVGLCEAHEATLVINDHADLAIASDAHGMHAGQHDLPLAVAQRILKPWQIAGTSNALLGEAEASLAAGADYIAVGRMFDTTSKNNTRPAGPETLRQVRALVPDGDTPIVGIGGITLANVARVAEAGADGICVISAVTQADDPRKAAAELLEAFRRAKPTH